jgi:osmoprotectant transport system permease protein
MSGGAGPAGAGAGAVRSASGPIIPNFGRGSACVRGDHTFCWGWVQQHWHDTLEPALVQHLELTAIAVGTGFAIAMTLALLTHWARVFDHPIGVFSALLYTIPSLALFQLLVPLTGITWTTVEIALVAYTLVILYPNISAGLRSAPPDVLEAARGMGLTPQQVLWRVELPLAVPAIIAGLRIAVVSTISIGTIAAFLLPKGLGYPIFIALGSPTPFKTEIYAAGVLAIGLALLCDSTLLLLQRLLVPWARLRFA